MNECRTRTASSRSTPVRPEANPHGHPGPFSAHKSSFGSLKIALHKRSKIIDLRSKIIDLNHRFEVENYRFEKVENCQFERTCARKRVHLPTLTVRSNRWFSTFHATQVSCSKTNLGAGDLVPHGSSRLYLTRSYNR